MTSDRLPPLVLLPGWSMHGKVFAPLVEAMPYETVQSLELPGYASAEANEMQAWNDQSTLIECLLGQLPEEPCVLVGWSLGGSLAILLAHAHPERISGVVLLACNPCFVAQEGRPGMNLELFYKFQTGINSDLAVTLRRFHQLCCQGSPKVRSRIRWLRDIASYSGNSQALDASLTWLAGNYFESFEALRVPCMSLLAADDALVPVELATSLPGSVSVVENSSHMIFVDQPERVAELITGFLCSTQESS